MCITMHRDVPCKTEECSQKQSWQPACAHCNALLWLTPCRRPPSHAAASLHPACLSVPPVQLLAFLWLHHLRSTTHLINSHVLYIRRRGFKMGPILNPRRCKGSTAGQIPVCSCLYMVIHTGRSLPGTFTTLQSMVALSCMLKGMLIWTQASIA